MGLHLFDREEPGPAPEELLNWWGFWHRRDGRWDHEDKAVGAAWALMTIDNTERGEDGLGFCLYATKGAALWGWFRDRLDLYFEFTPGQSAQDYVERNGSRPVDDLARVFEHLQALRDEGYCGDWDIAYKLEEVGILK